MAKMFRRSTAALVIAAMGMGTALAIPPAVSGGPSQITGAAPPPTDNFAVEDLSGPADPVATEALVTRLNAALAALPADAEPAEIEAAIVFAIDQANQPFPVVLAALAAIDMNRLGLSAQRAVLNVRVTRNRALQRGTGSIAGSFDISSGFTPDLSVNGGSSDYSA